MDDEDVKALIAEQRRASEAAERRHRVNSSRFRLTIIVIVGIAAIVALLNFINA